MSSSLVLIPNLNECVDAALGDFAPKVNREVVVEVLILEPVVEVVVVVVGVLKPNVNDGLSVLESVVGLGQPNPPSEFFISPEEDWMGVELNPNLNEDAGINGELDDDAEDFSTGFGLASWQQTHAAEVGLLGTIQVGHDHLE
jgi:hypothetical protein